MNTNCPVAMFVRERIQVTGKPQKDIAEEAGFEKPNLITMIKQGKTKLPIAKVGAMAAALEADPVQLLKLCISTYHPETWRSIEPFLDSTLTEVELRIVKALRGWSGTPYLSALNDESKSHLDMFINSLRPAAPIQ